MPVTFRDKIKSTFWAFVAPFWPAFVHLARLFGFKPYGERQPYSLGFLAPGKKPEDFHRYLLSLGFVEDALAWIDDDQWQSLRQFEGFSHQRHLRIYKDGEVRAHYELTPEHDPIGHLRDGDTHELSEEFMKLLEGWVVRN